MGKGRRNARLKHPLLVGFFVLLAAFASSNVSHAGPSLERGWDLFETVPGPAPGTLLAFDDAGPMRRIARLTVLQFQSTTTITETAIALPVSEDSSLLKE
jgi:hypothetical protein